MFETREESVKRLIKAKYGLKIDVRGLLGVYDVIDRDQGDHWLSATYWCESTGEPRILEPDKCARIGWFTLEQIQKLELSRITRLNVKDMEKAHERART